MSHPATARPPPRLPWLATALGLAGFAVFEVVVHGLEPALVLGFAVAPDLPMLAPAGRVAGHAHSRRALAALHHPAIPLALTGIAVAWLLVVRATVADPGAFEAARAVPLRVYAGAIAWLAHLTLDRALGRHPGLRAPRPSPDGNREARP